MLTTLQGTARAFPTSGAAAGTPMCVAPGSTDQLECYCTTATCGAGMLDVRAALLAAAYVTFAVVVAGLARLHVDSVPCGCFGAGSFTATRAHVALNLLAAAVAAICALDPPAGPLDWFGDPLAGLAAVAAIACSTTIRRSAKS